jgi:hypothetical protein
MEFSQEVVVSPIDAGMGSHEKSFTMFVDYCIGYVLSEYRSFTF